MSAYNLPNRNCIFCGGPADSREHVFAKRLYERAQATKLAMLPGLYTEGKGSSHRPTHLLNTLTVRQVCRGCNNGWMNKLEEWFEQRFGFLIEPKWPLLAAEFIESAKAERHMLAQWLMKTAVMFNAATMKGVLPVEFPPDAVAKVRDGVVPDYCWVDLGYSRLGTVGGAIGKCFRTVNGNVYQQSQIFGGFGFRFVVQFNHLLLRLALAPGSNIDYDPQLGGKPLRIYPVSDHASAVTPSYQDIMQFEHSVVLKTWADCAGNIARKG